MRDHVVLLGNDVDARVFDKRLIEKLGRGEGEEGEKKEGTHDCRCRVGEEERFI